MSSRGSEQIAGSFASGGFARPAVSIVRIPRPKVTGRASKPLVVEE
jgi:hypothetical protein